MKTKIFLAIALVCMMGGVGCDDGGSLGKPHTVEPIDTTGTPIVYPLAGTKWKLIAFVNSVDGTVTYPDYTNPELEYMPPEYRYSIDTFGTYTVKFTSDTSYEAKMCECIFWGDYAVDYDLFTFGFTRIIRPDAEDIPCGELYFECMKGVTAFETYETLELKNVRLKLYYNDKKNYLLFKLFKKEEVNL